MAYKISLNELKLTVSRSYFANEGDDYERTYWSFFNESFPNCELFWRKFIVPYTKRIEPQANDRLLQRDGISEDLFNLGLTHYSMFINLIYAHNHMREPRLSSFEDFYVHLGTTCDLVEAFLCRSYLMLLGCSNRTSNALKQRNKAEFLEITGNWFDSNYLKEHNNYVSRQKPIMIHLSRRDEILNEYFQTDESWKQYKKLTRFIKEYRNLIVHEVKFGEVVNYNDVQLVPRKEKIQNYKSLKNVFAAVKDVKKLRVDFIEKRTQMWQDMAEFQANLNRLWEKPIRDLEKLLYEDKNKTLLQKYNLELS
jgi:hypothetical protein